MELAIAIVLGVVVGGVWSGEFGAAVGAALGWLVAHQRRQARLIDGLQQALSALKQMPAQAAAFRRADATPQAAPAEPADGVRTERSPAGSAAAQPMPGVEPATSIAREATPPPVVPPAMPAAVPPLRAQTPLGPDVEAVYDEFEPTAPGVEPVPPRSAAPAPYPSAPQPAAGRVLHDTAPDPLAPIKTWLFGGNAIVKAGVAILFIGLAFLAKFASEHVQVPIELRLAGIGAVGVVLLVLGWRLREQRAGYAQALQGGAVAVLYLTLFASLKLYGVTSALPVFVLMVAVAALSAALAVLQNAKALAVLGALGGFAAPLLVSTGSGNHVALFAYYLVLDVGIAAVAWHRTWRALNLIGFVGTFVIGTAWGVLRYRSEHYASCQAFLIAYFVLFVAIMLMPARRAAAEQGATTHGASAPAMSERWLHGSLLFGLPTVSFALQYALVRHMPYGPALSALALAAFYVVLARVLRTRPQMALAFEGSLAVGTVFLTLVIPFALDARSTAGAWALEGAGLVWLGLRQARGRARAFGYALLALAGLTLGWAYGHHGTPQRVLNPLFFNSVLIAVASLAAALAWHRALAAPATDRARWGSAEADTTPPLLVGWGVLWLLLAAAVQIDAFVPQHLALAAWLAVCSGIALLLAMLSRTLRWPLVALPAIGHAPVHAIGACVWLATLLPPLAQGGAWAWPLALLAHAVVLRLLAPHWQPTARDGVHALGALTLAALGALQGRALTADWGDALSAWPWLGWLVVPAVLLLLLPRAGLARRWPVSEAPAAYQTLAAGVMAAALLLWVLAANLGSNGSARPLPHVPLLNPLDIGIAIALVAAWRWARSAAAAPLRAAQPALAPTLLSASAFVWLNAMLIRAFHHLGGVPFHPDAWMQSLAVQTGLTLLWTVIALGVMWAAARRAHRTVWLVGAALLAAVVIKLVLVDLSGTGTLTRIVSFIGVGVLMLVIGYVAPLPAKPEVGHAST